MFFNINTIKYTLLLATTIVCGSFAATLPVDNSNNIANNSINYSQPNAIHYFSNPSSHKINIKNLPEKHIPIINKHKHKKMRVGEQDGDTTYGVVNTLSNVHVSKLLHENIKWYTNWVCKKRSPIECLYFKDPQKYKKAFWAWLTWMQTKSNQLLAAPVAESHIYAKIKQSTYLINNGYGNIMYFYRPGCHFCEDLTLTIRKLQLDGFHVYEINVDKHPNAVADWGITNIPTLILVSPQHHQAFKFVGYSDYYTILNTFYSDVYHLRHPNSKQYDVFYNGD